MTPLIFTHLNAGWNAEPNAPHEEVTVDASTLALTFYLNPRVYSAKKGEKGRLVFDQCMLWRLGSTNDEGWYLGQCRYSKSAPAWGEFYELVGQDDEALKPTDWRRIGPLTTMHKHFLFYLRDTTFECFATTWRFQQLPIL